MFNEKEREIINSASSEAVGLEKLARAYHEGNYGLEKDDEQAFFCLKMSTWKGNDTAANMVGYFLMNGIGTEQDYREAFLYYLHAAKHGHVTSQYVMGKFYSDEKFSQGTCFINDYTAHLWFEKAANHGDCDAIGRVAEDYYAGRGVPYDVDKALYWYEQGARKGNVGCMYNTAFIYYGGAGMSYENPDKAGYWFNEAAQRGDRQAQQALSQYKYSSFSKKWKKI